jgi:hypothetical protein
MAALERQRFSDRIAAWLRGAGLGGLRGVVRCPMAELLTSRGLAQSRSRHCQPMADFMQGAFAHHGPPL